MITILHPTVRMIMSKYGFIHNLIALYPDFYKSWENDYESKMRATIDQIAEGDPIIKSSMHQYSPISENEEEMMNMFYQAMAIEVYAFYETSLLFIHKQENIPGYNFRTIKEKRKIRLSQKAQQENEFVYNLFRVFRNYIAHNVDAEPEDDHRAVLSVSR